MTNSVDIENVSLVFGGEGNNPVLAVDTINIAIPKGQFVAIVGPSGCGKTTVLNMLSGLIRGGTKASTRGWVAGALSLSYDALVAAQADTYTR